MIREAIKREMSEQGISQQKVCAEIGITKGALSSYLSGRFKLSIEKIEAIMEFLNLEITRRK